MSEQEQHETNRRAFLQVGAIATASTIAASPTVTGEDEPAKRTELPRRILGKTGLNVTIVDQGTLFVTGLDKLLRLGFERGVRVFDTAAAYRTEPSFKKWFDEKPDVRKQIVLISKTIARDLDQFVADLDQRLEACGTDHLDLYLWHAMGDHGEAIEFPKSPEFAKAVDKIKKSGKAKFVGFSTHHRQRADYIKSAAEGGFLDAIMTTFSPFLKKDDPLNKALDAAHKEGIGLISMKQFAGQWGGERGLPTPLQQVVERMAPVLKERNLTPHQGVLQAVWSDERIAMSCVTINNTDHLRDNTDAARQFTPMNISEIKKLGAAAMACRPTFCPGCDGRCEEAAGTSARLGDLTRYLTYYEHHGHRDNARRQYSELTNTERDWSKADLTAARDACLSRLDFASLLPEADRLLG